MDTGTRDLILRDSAFRVGKVISVEGRSIKVKVDKNKNTSHILYDGKLIKNVSVGSYLKIAKGFIKIIGKVEGEYINESKNYWSKDYKNQKEKIDRILDLKMLGFFEEESFKRGIKELPLIDNECFLVDSEEFSQIHNFIRDNDQPIVIGKLSLEKSQDIKVGINSLFASHVGIFGNTGSGKSYTLAKIYRELFKIYKDNENFKKNANFFLLDFNGEYIKEDCIIEKKYKKRYKLSTREANGKDKFPLKPKDIKDPDFWIVFLTATEKTQSPFVKRTLKKEDIRSENIEGLIRDIVVNGDRKIERGIILNFLENIKDFLNHEINISNLKNALTYHGTYASYKIDEVFANNEPDNAMNKIKGKLLNGSSDFYLKKDISELQKIHIKIIFYYYQEIARGFSNQEHIAPLIKRFEKRINDLEKVIDIQNNTEACENRSNFTVLSLKDVNIDIKKILPLLLCRKFYEEKKKENNDSKYLNLIIDEAHNILSSDSERESEHWRDYRLETFEEIIKEGRKFGVFLTIASQRPSDISSTIISQIHNYFLHRLINEKDMLAVRNTISYLDKVSFEYLPIVPTGTAILAGLLAQVPVVIDIEKIESEQYEPDNKTINLTKNWGKKEYEFTESDF